VSGMSACFGGVAVEGCAGWVRGWLNRRRSGLSCRVLV